MFWGQKSASILLQSNQALIECAKSSCNPTSNSINLSINSILAHLKKHAVQHMDTMRCIYSNSIFCTTILYVELLCQWTICSKRLCKKLSSSCLYEMEPSTSSTELKCILMSKSMQFRVYNWFWFLKKHDI